MAGIDTGDKLSTGRRQDQVRTASRRHWIEYASYLGVIWVAVLVLLCAATWAHESWGPPGGAAMTLPLGPGRQLHVNFWKPGPDYASTDLNRGVLITNRGPLNLMLWYQDRVSGTMLRLGSVKLISWPLLVHTAAFAALAVWLRQRARLCRKGDVSPLWPPAQHESS